MSFLNLTPCRFQCLGHKPAHPAVRTGPISAVRFQQHPCSVFPLFKFTQHCADLILSFAKSVIKLFYGFHELLPA